MLSSKYNKYLLTILILILFYNLFINYRHSLIEGMVTDAKDCFSKLKDCIPPKNNKNSDCEKIQKDSSGNYYQVCPSDNKDNHCSQYCPYNWKFEVDSSGNKINDTNIVNVYNEKYNMIADYNSNKSKNDNLNNNCLKNHDSKNDNTRDIISFNCNSGLDTSAYPLLSSNNLLYNHPPFTSQHSCMTSTTGAFTDCGPMPYNSSNNDSANNIIKSIASELIKLTSNKNNNEKSDDIKVK